MTKTTKYSITIISLLLLGTMSMIIPADASSITLTPISTPFNRPVGIDHHVPTNNVVITVNYPNGLPSNFELVAADGTRTVFAPTVSGLTDEVKIATAKDDGGGLTIGGFTAGELFVGNGHAGQIVRISADGTTVQNPWVTLPSESGLLRGSLHVDRTGVFNGDLIVVTTAGNVWRVTESGVPTKVASLETHLEGLITVPDDSRYGPWAGKILTGAEQQGRIYTIDTSGDVSFFILGINPEDFEIIPTNQNFFGVNYAGARLMGADASQFTSMVGDILIVQESPGNLYRVTYDSFTNSFIRELIATVPQWEHVTFSTAGIVEIPPIEICGDEIDNDRDGQVDEGCNTAPTAQDDTFTIAEDTTLNSSVTATDAESNPLSYMIVGPTPVGLTFNTDGTFSYIPASNFYGTISFQFKANDGEFDSNIATITITVTSVNDTPICSAATTNTSFIWPPNHKMIPINVSMSTTDVDGDLVTISTSSIFQDEPTNGLGDGDTSPDATLSPAQVRAERSGTGDGRVYIVTVTADDGNGGSCSGTVQINVPHSMKKPVTAVNSGTTYDSTTP